MDDEQKELYIDSLGKLNLVDKIEQLSNTTILDGNEKLEQLNMIASDLANQYTFDMSILEETIEDVIDDLTDDERDVAEYSSVEDVTQDINVTRSCDY